MNKTVMEIVQDYLKKNNYDGLINKEHRCSCSQPDNTTDCMDFSCTAICKKIQPLHNHKGFKMDKDTIVLNIILDGLYSSGVDFCETNTGITLNRIEGKRYKVIIKVEEIS